MAHAGSPSSIAPAGVSVGQAIFITGTGFDSISANHLVTFTPSSGPPVTADVTAVATLDAAAGIRRLAVKVPEGLPVGTVSIHITNRTSGEVVDARSVDIVSLTLPDVSTATPGASGLAVRIVASPNTRFTAATRLTFGPGISVRSTTIESPTDIVAMVDVAPTAAIGLRDVAAISPTQRAALRGGLQWQSRFQPIGSRQ
jgi:hypothetical protein